MVGFAERHLRAPARASRRGRWRSHSRPGPAFFMASTSGSMSRDHAGHRGEQSERAWSASNRLPCPPACPWRRRAAGPSSPRAARCSAPTMRPVLARTSSAASGLRFCGMIEEPVVKRSDSLTKPNCGVVQITISSAKRERCMAQIEAAASVSSDEVAVGRPNRANWRSAGRSRAPPPSSGGRSGTTCRRAQRRPSGHSLKRLRASANRPRSRPSIST